MFKGPEVTQLELKYFKIKTGIKKTEVLPQARASQQTLPKANSRYCQSPV